MSKFYSQAPLPFMGQKRRWCNEFKSALKQFDDCTIFVDLFGGSGLLSHLVSQVRPDAHIVYNDYDDYHIRIQNIPQTNKLLADIRILVGDIANKKQIPNEIKVAILKRIKKEDSKGYVDYISISASLLFSMKYVTSYNELTKQTFYNRVRKTDYDAESYLDGLSIVKQDYKELFNKWKYYDNVVFLIDPPYLSTEVGCYSNYWKFANYLDVLHTLKGTNYFYFTSNKSSITEFCNWIEQNLAAENPFKGATQKTITSYMNYNAKYDDIMLFKHR